MLPPIFPRVNPAPAAPAPSVDPHLNTEDWIMPSKRGDSNHAVDVVFSMGWREVCKTYRKCIFVHTAELKRPEV